MKGKKRQPEKTKNQEKKPETQKHNCAFTFFGSTGCAFPKHRLCFTIFLESPVVLFPFWEARVMLLAEKPGVFFLFQGNTCGSRQKTLLSFFFSSQNLRKTKQKPKSIKNQKENQIKPENCADQTKTKEPKNPKRKSNKTRKHVQKQEKIMLPWACDKLRHAPVGCIQHATSCGAPGKWPLWRITVK